MEPSSLGEAVLSTAIDLSGLDGGLTRAEGHTREKANDIGSAFGEEFKKGVKSLLSGAAIIAILEQVYERVKELMHEAIELSDAEALSLARLEAATHGSTDRLEAFAEAQAHGLGIAKAVTLAQEGQIASLAHLSGTALVEATLAAQRWSAMSHKGMEESATDVAKFIENGTNLGFRRYGLAVSDTGTALGNLAVLSAAVAGGQEQMEKQAASSAGAMNKLHAETAMLLTQFGASITETDAWRDALGTLTTMIREMEDSGDLERLGHDIAIMADFGAQVVVVLEKLVGGLLKVSEYTTPLGVLWHEIHQYIGDSGSATEHLGTATKSWLDKVGGVDKYTQTIAEHLSDAQRATDALVKSFEALDARGKEIAEQIMPGITAQAEAQLSAADRFKQTVEQQEAAEKTAAEQRKKRMEEFAAAAKKHAEEQKKAEEERQKLIERNNKAGEEIYKLWEKGDYFARQYLSAHKEIVAQVQQAVAAEQKKETILESQLRIIRETEMATKQWNEEAWQIANAAYNGNVYAQRYLQSHQEILRFMEAETREQMKSLGAAVNMTDEGLKLQAHMREILDLEHGHYNTVKATGAAWAEATQQVDTYQQAIQNVQAAMHGQAISLSTGNAALDYLFNKEHPELKGTTPIGALTSRGPLGTTGGYLGNELADIRQNLYDLQHNKDILSAAGINDSRLTGNFTSLDQVSRELQITNQLLRQMSTRGRPDNPMVTKDDGSGNNAGLRLAQANIKT